jgi:DNA-binding CsgD family transcriptional regulator
VAGVSLCATDVDLVRDAVAKVAATLEPSNVLSRVARGAADLCRTPLAAITMLTGGGDQLSLLDVFGTGGRIVERVLPVKCSINGTVVMSGRSFRSPDVWRDSRPITRAIAKRNRTRSVLIVPLAARGQLDGTLAVARRRPGSFSARDQAVLETFASIACLAIENARLREQIGRESGVARDIRPVPDRLSPHSGHPVTNGFRLTRREQEIVDLLMADRTCPEVASVLQLSIHTVRHHIERLKHRCGQSTLHGLVSLLASHRP